MKRFLLSTLAFVIVAGLASWVGLFNTASVWSQTRLNSPRANQTTYAVEVAGKFAGFFSEVSGLGSENEVIEQKVLGDDGQERVKKLPGRLKWQDISLKRGITTDLDAWQWRQEVITGGVEAARSDGTIRLLGPSGNVVAVWEFENAWPSKISAPQPKADGNDISLEELTIVHEHIVRVKE